MPTEPITAPARLREVVEEQPRIRLPESARQVTASDVIRQTAYWSLNLGAELPGAGRHPSVKRSKSHLSKDELWALTTKFITELAIEGRRTDEWSAVSYFDSDAGEENFVLHNQRGERRELTKKLSIDVQSVPAIHDSQPIPIIASQNDVSQAVLPSEKVGDYSLSLEERLDALRQWMADDNDAASQFVIQELASDKLSGEWRNVLIYAAEAVRFRDADSKTRAVDVLLKHATELRRSTEQNVSEVVWCAIHRIGSIIPIQRAKELSVFLGPSRPIDTRLAALQAIVRIFEVAPPVQPADFLKLADCSIELATALWNPIVFTVGEISAIAIEATVASATLADERVLELVSFARTVGRPWVMKKLQRRFNELLSLWQNLPSASSSRLLLKDALACASQYCEERR